MKQLFLVIFLFLLTQNLLCNWELVTLPSGSGTARDIFYSTGFLFSKSSDGKIFRSSDNGNTWLDISGSLPTTTSDVHFIVNWNNLFVSLYNKGIYRTSNNGDNWISCLAGLNGKWLGGMSCNNSFLLINTVDTITYQKYFAYSSDMGNTWTVTINSTGYSGFLCENNFFGLSDNSLYVSSNWGANWVSKYNFNSSVHLSAMFYEPQLNYNLYLTGNSTSYHHLLFRSTDYGASWNSIDSTLPPQTYSYISCINAKNGVLLVGQDQGLFITTNQGVNWMDKTDNLGSYCYVFEMAVNDSYLFVRIAGSDIYRRLLSDVIGIQKISNEIPQNFKLKQNYPNPFNPSTQIEFAISQNNLPILLKVFNIEGKEITKLVDEKLNAGTYKVVFNGDDLPSGIYFYRIETGTYLETRKMILIK